MSNEINNREYRKQVIKEILMDLHDGKSVDEARRKFSAAFAGVASSEIAGAEAALIAEGVPLEEVQRLCDVHASLFKDTPREDEIAEEASNSADRPGHPANTLLLENRAIEKFIGANIQPPLDALAAGEDKQALSKLKFALIHLADIKLHYQRKENLIFPYMERHDITAPPKVMWGVDDEIRTMINEAVELASDESAGPEKVTKTVGDLVVKINEMIFKEENIMIPMVLEVFSQSEWKRIADDSDEIGYCFIPKPPIFKVSESAAVSALAGANATGSIVLPTGALKIDELVAILDALPVDLTFVDSNDVVKYFSQGGERVFPRTKSIVGRNVVNCHPPASVHIVEGILADFKSGKKNSEDFWIDLKGKYVYIRYLAIRGEKGEYLGTLEVTQDIAPIQAITGEKRLVTG